VTYQVNLAFSLQVIAKRRKNPILNRRKPLIMGGIRTIKKSHHQRQEKAKLNNNQILVK
jgi:hypothetical protein